MGRDQGFCNEITKALLTKKLDQEGRGVKHILFWLSIMDDPKGRFGPHDYSVITLSLIWMSFFVGNSSILSLIFRVRFELDRNFFLFLFSYRFSITSKKYVKSNLFTWDTKIVAVVDRWSLFRGHLVIVSSKWDLKSVVVIDRRSLGQVYCTLSKATWPLQFWMNLRNASNKFFYSIAHVLDQTL